MRSEDIQLLTDSVQVSSKFLSKQDSLKPNITMKQKTDQRYFIFNCLSLMLKKKLIFLLTYGQTTQDGMTY